MRILKIFLVGFIGLLIFIALFSLIIPANVKISRAVLIHSTKEKAFEQIADLKNWRNWHPLFKNDSVTISFSNANSTKSDYCDLKYRNKETNIRVTRADTNGIQFMVRSVGENDAKNEISFHSTAEQNALQVEWRVAIKMRWYPWEKFYGIFIDKLSGPGYEDALNGLKNYLESHDLIMMTSPQ